MSFQDNLIQSSIDRTSLNELHNQTLPSGGRVCVEPIKEGEYVHTLKKQHITDYKDALKGVYGDTLLSKTFFSKENIQIIQNAIRRGVYDLSNKKFIIPEQDVNNIKTIMRNVYLENGRYMNTHIKQQVQELNQYVIDFCVPVIYNECISHQKYLDDVRLPYQPMSRPVLTTNKGSEVLERTFKNISIF